MGIFQVVCMGLLAAISRAQGLPSCGVDTSPPSVIRSSEDATTLAVSLQCSNGDFVVEWEGKVDVEQTINVASGTSLNITGAGPDAIADGGGNTQLFFVDGGSSLHLSDMTLTNGYASYGGAILTAHSSSVSLGGNTTFISNTAADDGGAICALNQSTVFLDGDGIQFRHNSAASNGGALYAMESTVSCVGNGADFTSNTANDGEGGAICAMNSSRVIWDGRNSRFSNNSAGSGGAIASRDSSVVSRSGDGMEFISNSALLYGGAIGAAESNLSWNGTDTQFISNSAGLYGGALLIAKGSTVSWIGDRTVFSDNSADSDGGALLATESSVSLVGDGIVFSNNLALESGGAIASVDSSVVSWVGDRTQFSNNSATFDGGAVYATDASNMSWTGDGTEFISNSAQYGGAISILYSSAVSWNGTGTRFSSNSALIYGGAIEVLDSNVTWAEDGAEFTSNFAGFHGGAIFGSENPTMSMGINTVFSENIATDEGGALALIDFNVDFAEPFDGMRFVGNSARQGGAVYALNCENGFYFKGATFQSNLASDAGGAVVAHAVGNGAFVDCSFLHNTSNGTGGAVDTLAGAQYFDTCAFTNNSADTGGAMRLGGEDYIMNCSFHSNSALTRGLAISVVGSGAEIVRSMFDGNELYCAAGLYRNDTEHANNDVARVDEECFGCFDWDENDWEENSNNTINRGHVTPACEPPLAHTIADEPGVTLETLTISGGWWRATNVSYKILACYNADACEEGLTDTSNSSCAEGYKGPYCAVCDTNYSRSVGHTCTKCSSSKLHGLIAATAIAAVVAVFAVRAIVNFLLSTEEGVEKNTGCFHRRILRAVPVQALKIILVVWQILTQFADAANVTFPGVYQDFVGIIDIVNFDIGSVLAAGCLWPDIDFHGHLLISTIWPLAGVGFLAMTYRIAVYKSGASGDSAVVECIFRKHLTALLSLTFLVYSSASSKVFQTFACETLDDGIEYLRADYRIHCTDAKHKAFEAYAGVMVLVYPVGIPLMYSVLLFQLRDILANADADKTIAQPIAGLWEPYKPEGFYYEVLECGRRVLLTGVVVFIFPNDAAQIAVTMLIAVFFLLIFEALSPYKSESDMWLARGGHLVVFLSMFDLLLLKVDVSGERDQSQAAFAGVLVAGHVLMMLAIVVQVVGVGYASVKKKVDAGAVSSERTRAGSDDVPVFETTPGSWRSILGQNSVSEKAGPIRSVSGAMVEVDRP